MALKQITSSFSVAPQLTENDVAAAAQAGFRSIVAHLPPGGRGAVSGLPVHGAVGEALGGLVSPRSDQLGLRTPIQLFQ